MSPRKKSLAEYGNVFEEFDPTSPNEQQSSESEESKNGEELLNEENQNKDEELQQQFEESDKTEDDFSYLEELKTKGPVYIKKTYEIEKSLLKEMNALHKRYGHGFHKKFINNAIRKEIQRIKELEKKKKS